MSQKENKQTKKTFLKSLFNFSELDELRILRLFAIIGLFSVILLPLLILIINSLGGLSAIYARTFSDFAETAAYAFANNPYSGEYGISAFYSPIAFYIVYPFALIAKEPVLEYLKDPNAADALSALSQTWQVRLGAILFFAFWELLICLFMARLSRYKGEKLIYWIIICLTFGPILHALFRGNTVIASTFFCLVFLGWYNEKSRVKRELALISLGIATAIKIFPFLLGVLLLRKKDWFGGVRAAIYFLIIYFLPFVFLDGNFQNVKPFIENLVKFLDRGLKFDWCNIGFKSYVAAFYALWPNRATYWVSNILGWSLSLAYLALMLVATFLFKDGKKKMPYVAMIMCGFLLIPSISFQYNAACCLFLLLLFAKECHLYSRKDKIVYLVLYSLLIFYGFNVYIYFSSTPLVIIALAIKSSIDTYREGLESRKQEALEGQAIGEEINRGYNSGDEREA